MDYYLDVSYPLELNLLSYHNQQINEFLENLNKKKDLYDGFINLGCVIRGETYHFEIVANESSRALTELALNYSIPIGNGILTVSNKDQAIKRSDPSQLNKGADAALACLSLINIKTQLLNFLK